MGVCVQSLEGFSQMEFSSNRADVHPLVAGCEGDFWCLLERELSACPWLLLSRTQVALQFERYAGGTGFRWVNCKKKLEPELRLGRSLEVEPAVAIVEEFLSRYLKRDPSPW